MKISPRRLIQGRSYELVFYDGFESGTLNTDHWIPYYLPHWSSRKSSTARYAMDADGLVLKIDRDQRPWCPEFNGGVRVSSLQTGLFAGPVNSRIGQHRFSNACTVREAQPTEKRYLHKYGFTELRARCDISANNVAALWMIGFEDAPQKSGEICIFELKGNNIGVGSSVIGYGVHPFGDSRLVDEFFEDRFDLDVEAYNTYAVDWTPNAIDFYINDRKVRTIHQSPGYEMQLMLNIYDLEDRNAEAMSFYIDYVAGYQHTERQGCP